MLRPAQHMREKERMRETETEMDRKNNSCAQRSGYNQAVCISVYVEPEGDRRVAPQVPGELMGPKGSRQAEQPQSICTIDFSHCSRPDGGGA